MQIDAIRKLGMTAERVANAAQGIYQNGHTTYIRTDSISMSDDALNASEKQIKEEFGSKYSQRKQHQSKGKNTQESHECIRPTDFSKHEIEGTSDEKRLYELIWKRAMASQMSNCVVDKTLITIVADGLKEEFQTRGEIIKFDGYKKLYTEENFDENKEEDDDKTILPTVKNGQPINTIQIDGMEIFQRPKALFTEATLLKELETIGVGRPSTIATIKKTLTTRLYIDKKDLPAKKRDVCNVQLKNNTIEEEIRTENFGKEVGKLIPTDLGIIVCDFLLKNFPDLMNQNYTSELEDLLDLIASGKEDFKKVLTEFNNVFQQNLKNAKGNTEKIGVRLLGNDPKSGKPIYAKLGRFGPMIQLGESVKQDKSNKDKKEKSDVKFTKIPDDESIESITLENALKLLAWPRLLGEHKGKEVTCAIGRFGPYVKYNDKFYSIKEQDPNTITLKESLEIIKTLDEAKKENGTANNGKIKEFKKEEIVVLNGKFGAYIKYKNKNYKISDEYDASKITKEECFDIIKSKFKKK
jgi:DNA topoisomerase-1